MKLKGLTLFLICSFIFSLRTSAQQETVYGHSVADGQAGNCYFSIGQPFAMQWGDDSFLFTEGVAQAHLINLHFSTDTCEGEGYSNICFEYDAQTLPGVYRDSCYRHAATRGYDSVLYLSLNIHPVYARYDTLLFYDRVRGNWQEGDNVIAGTTVFGCDSNRYVHVIVKPFECGDPLYDDEDNIYGTLEIAGACWTKENMRSTIYPDGSKIAVAVIYSSPNAHDTTGNLATYGRLYTWYSAVNIPEGSTLPPPYDADFDSLVTGICPYGWHIPTLEEFQALASYGADALRSTNLWLQPGTNSSNFTARPAGNYNPVNQRFENLLGKTFLWTTEPVNQYAYTTQIRFSCEAPLFIPEHKSAAFSVRCVKN